MNGIVQFRKCTLSNEDLIAAVDTLTDAIYTTGRIPTRHIPARPNEDYDLLVGELLLRFSALLEPIAQNTTKEPVIDWEEARDNFECLIGYLESYLRTSDPPGELEDVINEAKDWLKSNLSNYIKVK